MSKFSKLASVHRAGKRRRGAAHKLTSSKLAITAAHKEYHGSFRATHKGYTPHTGSSKVSSLAQAHWNTEHKKR